MDYSPLLSQIDHPLLLDPEFDETDNDVGDHFQKVKLDEGEEFNVENNTINNTSSTGKGFFRRSKSKMEEIASSGSPGKKSNPIEIKGSPGHHKSSNNNNNNKEKSQQGSNSSSSGSSGRMSFFKVLTRRNSSTNQGKHKKMTDKWLEGAGEPVMDGVAFCVKFLGSTLIEKTGAVDAAEATKTVIQMTKAGHKPTRLGLTVCTNGITLSDPTTGEIRLEISIYDIAHCSADSNHPNVFSFIATNKNDINECYCFATRKKKMAQHITLTIAKAFNLAFELWQNSSLENCGGGSSVSSSDIVEVIVGSTDSGQSHGSTGSDIRDWVAFDQDNNHQEELTNRFSHAINLVTLSPFHRPNPSRRLRPPPEKNGDDLLICLN